MESSRAPFSRSRAASGKVGRPKTWTDEKIIEAICAFYAEHGRYPTHADLRAPMPPESAIRREFGSLRAACRSAGDVEDVDLAAASSEEEEAEADRIAEVHPLVSAPAPADSAPVYDPDARRGALLILAGLQEVIDAVWPPDDGEALAV